MKRIIITAGAALLAAVPASMGLVGNTSFAQSVPVRVPAHAVVLDDSSAELDDTTPEAGDDKDPVAAVTTPKAVEDNGGVTPHVEAGDDNGQDATETGDDSDGDAADAPETGDDNDGDAADAPETGDDNGQDATEETNTTEDDSSTGGDSGSGKDDNGGDSTEADGSDDGSGHS